MYVLKHLKVLHTEQEDGPSNTNFMANERLSYAFSVWRMEGAWGQQQQ